MMIKINNVCYLDLENKVVAIDAPTLEEAREYALNMLNELGIENEYAEMHRIGLVDEDILPLNVSREEGEQWLNNKLSDEQCIELIMRDYEPILREALHRLLEQDTQRGRKLPLFSFCRRVYNPHASNFLSIGIFNNFCFYFCTSSPLVIFLKR